MPSEGQGEEQDEMRVDAGRASQLVSAVKSVQQSMQTAAASSSSATPMSRPPRLVAVSKLKPASDILALHQSSLGLTHFGENYLQELEQKARLLPRTVDWHFIGGLQTNKCKPLAEGIPNLWAVESVDTAKKADQLEKGRATLCASDEGQQLKLQRDGGLRVYIQINTSGEESKSGVEPGEDAVALCRHVKEKCPHLKLQGLMTIGAIARSQSASDENEDFIALRNERSAIVKALGIANEDDLELSMGMSADFEGAIKQGSSQVRVGSQIFGARPPKKSQEAKESVEKGGC